MKFGSFNKFWGSRSLQFDIIVAFVLITMATVFSIIWYSYYNNTKSAIKFSNVLLEEISSRTIDNTLTYMNKARTMTNLGAYLIAQSDQIDNNNEAIVLYMIGVLNSHSYLTSIYAGDEAGHFLQIIRMNERSTYRSHPSDLLPGGIHFAIRYIDRQDGVTTESWRYSDENGIVRETESIPQVMFDHRVRSWYIGARRDRKFSFSDVYIFALSRRPGLSASQPLFTGYGNQPSTGKFFGVVGVDIDINETAKFVEKANLGEEGIAFIVDTEGGELVAHPNPDLIVEVDHDDVRVRVIHDLDDKRLVHAYQDYINHGKENFFFDHDGVEYYALFAKFPDTFEKKWAVGIVAPSDVFIGAIKQTQFETVMISLIIFLLSIILIIIISRNIAKPIVQLAHEADKIKRFDLQNGKEVDTSVYELQLLNTSISTMRNSIQAFAKYAPKEIVSKLTQKSTDVKIGGRQRPLTIFFSDIANFTTVSESYPSDKLMQHLSEYFEELTSIIQHEKGTIDKYIGDAIMAFWGAPAMDKQHILNGCIAALKCQKKLQGLNRKWRSEGKPELRTRIGLHTADVIVGNVGSSDRMNYTILGDGVNLSARLESVNKQYGTEILVSHDVYDKTHRFCHFRPLDVVAVKGKKEGQKIYELVGMKQGEPSLFPSRERIEFIELFSDAFKVYLEQRWDEAIDKFSKIMERFGKDQVSEMYVKRCKDFKKNPPKKGWKGVIQLDKK
ncbi:MAG: adenylate/guanylate cyclase domain-containing protein [Alphaproteobacteria bacterium]